MIAIQTENLTKKYQDKYAVNALNLSVKQGELFALLGVNELRIMRQTIIVQHCDRDGSAIAALPSDSPAGDEDSPTVGPPG